ncbi:hypothetical protein CYY_000308 [Polysphondylium violaceum]|uniref:Uncharacterized protein n=1 Tax=Polysphondylium violaceum TaxID=133409 RepID=A0A8J4Q254_9MYCE|nr:hypothetical protein CYY_000308 [Polysphondylium violaceum]
MENLLPEFEAFALIHPTCLATTKHLLQQREYLSKQPLIFEIDIDGWDLNLMDNDYESEQELLSISTNFKPIIYENNNINNNINLNNEINNINNNSHENSNNINNINNNNNDNGFKLIKPKAIHLSKSSNIVTVSIPKVKKDIKKSLKRNNLLSISKMMKNNFYSSSRTELSSS